MERIEKLKEEIRKLRYDLQYYKGFYEGVKEMTTLLGDGPVEITHNINLNGLEAEEEKEETEEKAEMKVAVGKLEGEKAKKFIKMMEEMGVE